MLILNQVKRASHFVKITVAGPHRLPKLPKSTLRKQARPNNGSLFCSHCAFCVVLFLKRSRNQSSIRCVYCRNHVLASTCCLWKTALFSLNLCNKLHRKCDGATPHIFDINGLSFVIRKSKMCSSYCLLK
jgi:hypothetical protein